MKYKYLILSIFLTGFADAQNGSFKQDTIFSFKSISLGMTPAEFRSATPLTSPDSAKYRPVQILCASSDEPRGTFGMLIATDDSKFLKENGGDSCAYNDSILFFKYLSLNYGFHFIKAPNDSDPKLFNMWMEVDNKDYKELLSELKKKYGNPKTQTKPVSNAFNAKFLNEISTWENKVNKITLSKYASRIDTARLEYILKSHQKFFTAKKKEVKAKAPPKI